MSSRRIAIVMSRMPRLIAPEAIWLGGLRACLRRIRDSRQTLLIAPGTAGADFVLRGAQRLQIAVEMLRDEASERNVDPDTESAARRDRWLIESADDLFVLGVRPQGNVQRLLMERLHADRGSVCLIDLPGLQPDPVRQCLMAAGAITWTPTADDLRPLQEFDDVNATPEKDENRDSLVFLNSHPQSSDHLLLTHTTRACPGPWPRQPVEEYLDTLLDSLPAGDHSAMMTLTRIVRQRLLIASEKTIRGGYPVVSFTAVPLSELPALRCFRTHRSRWDFEPYGLCIRREALERHHVRPVLYGSEQTWKTLTDVERPFFQLSGNAAAESTATSPTDWSAEREWRHIGDLDLSGFTRDELFAFVPTFDDAKRLQPHCPWPITLWPGDQTVR